MAKKCPHQFNSYIGFDTAHCDMKFLKLHSLGHCILIHLSSITVIHTDLQCGGKSHNIASEIQ